MTSSLDFFLLDTSKLNSLLSFKNILSNNEREFLETITSEKRKKEFILSRYLLRKLLEDKFNVPKGLEFSKGPNGKPVIIDGPNFNISHSHNYIACVISNEFDVGIDIERSDKKNSYSEISKKYFNVNENEYIESEGCQKSQQKNFLKLWTLKESMFKLLALNFNSENSKLFFDFINCTIDSYPGKKMTGGLSSLFIEFNDLYISFSVDTSLREVPVRLIQASLVGSNLDLCEVENLKYKQRLFEPSLKV